MEEPKTQPPPPRFIEPYQGFYRKLDDLMETMTSLYELNLFVLRVRLALTVIVVVGVAVSCVLSYLASNAIIDSLKNIRIGPNTNY